MAATVRVDVTKMRQSRQDRAGRDAWLRGVADQMLGDVVKSFGDSPDGREYQHGSVVHVASQPGYPPNVDTGALRGSMRVKKEGVLNYRIIDGVLYGIMLEESTENVEARPFVGPVFDEWKKKIEIEAQDGLVP